MEGKVKTSHSVQTIKGVQYNFESLSSVFEVSQKKTQDRKSHETNMYNELQGSKLSLLRRIRDWKDCPESYRSRLYKRLQGIDVSKKTAILKLDEMIREIGILEFNLQLNPGWIRGLSKLVDEILDQSQRSQIDLLITEFGHLKEQFCLFKNTCNGYYMAK